MQIENTQNPTGRAVGCGELCAFSTTDSDQRPLPCRLGSLGDPRAENFGIHLRRRLFRTESHPASYTPPEM